jgi:hypothetical protein
MYLSNTKTYNGHGVHISQWFESDAAYAAHEKERNDRAIAWLISDIFARRWLFSVEATINVREKFAGEMAEMRGLSPEVFLWLVDNGYIACAYERKEIKKTSVKSEHEAFLQWVENDKKDVVEEPTPPEVIEYFNIAFPVYRDVEPGEDVPEYQKSLPTAYQFYGMHIPWTDRDGHKHWRYDPKGCPAHPYIINDVASADLVVIAESTWDAIAFIDLRKLWTWKRPWCVIATRGAGNAHRIPANEIKEGAVVVRLLQNDAANAAWVNSLPVMPQVEHREIAPPDGIKDINDWIREAGAENVLKAIW